MRRYSRGQSTLEFGIDEANLVPDAPCGHWSQRRRPFKRGDALEHPLDYPPYAHDAGRPVAIVDEGIPDLGHLLTPCSNISARPRCSRRDRSFARRNLRINRARRFAGRFRMCKSKFTNRLIAKKLAYLATTKSGRRLSQSHGRGRRPARDLVAAALYNPAARRGDRALSDPGRRGND